MNLTVYEVNYVAAQRGQLFQVTLQCGIFAVHT